MAESGVCPMSSMLSRLQFQVWRGEPASTDSGDVGVVLGKLVAHFLQLRLRAAQG
jgi:hypothetical protein